MTAAWLWLRRGTTTLVAPGLVAIVAVVIASRRGWEYEWGWGLSHAATSTMLLAPALAGSVAFDRARRFAPSFAELSAGTRRSGLFWLVIASWLVAMTALALGLGFVWWRLRTNGVTGAPDPWLLIQAPAGLLAAGFVGLAWGSTFRAVAAPPLLAIAVYVGTIASYFVGLPVLFAAGRATGSLIGMEQVPAVALGVVAMNLAVAWVSWQWAVRQTTKGRSGSPVLWGASVLVCAAVAVVSLLTLRGEDTYRPTVQALVCVDGTPQVCGPEDGLPLLRIAQGSVAHGFDVLRQSGITWQPRYVMAKGDDVLRLPHDTGLLRVSTEHIEDARLADADVAMTLAFPRMCAAFFGSEQAERLLADQGTVIEWVRAALAAPSPATPAPEQVVTAFNAISTCEPARATTQ